MKNLEKNRWITSSSKEEYLDMSLSLEKVRVSRKAELTAMIQLRKLQKVGSVNNDERYYGELYKEKYNDDKYIIITPEFNYVQLNQLELDSFMSRIS